MLDPIVTAAAVGLLLSPVAGKAILRAQERLPSGWRRSGTWLLVGAAVGATIIGDRWLEGRVKEGVFVLLLGAVPGIVVFVVWRTALASAIVCLVPLYFGIGAQTLGRPLHMPELALDRALPVQPAWMLVYGSLYVFVLLPIVVVRHDQLFRRALQAYLTVLILAYIGFVAYPTVAPRSEAVVAHGFAAWCLRLLYSVDQPYNCFPSLHVAHSFVSALTCSRVHKGVGIVAVLWASLVGVSTLYTKQHYVVDVIGGALIAYIAYLLFLRSFPRELIAERDRHLAVRRALWVPAIYLIAVVGFWFAYRLGAGAA